MKLVAALSLLVASASANPFAPKTQNDARAKYNARLMRGAVPTANSQLRNLEEYAVDISSYAVKFQQCQFVKSYDDDLAKNDESKTVLATNRFVIFRLCPDNSCSSCNYNYGEYLVDLASYLDATVKYFQEYQEYTCKLCDENCASDDAANADNGGRKLQDCSTCVEECQKIENMENNGYIDASNFLGCEMIHDPADDTVAALYAGPVCASSGTKIKIGVFTDENCLYLDTSKDVDDYLMNNDGGQMKLSHALLKMTYMDTCISCTEVNDNENDANDADKVVEMCEELYDSAAKCETTHGFANGYANVNGYENQLKEESVVCDFIQSIKSGTYDEQGEIIVSGSSASLGGGSSTTGGQKFALTFFTLGTVGLAVYAAMLHSKLTKGSKSDLSSGAMA